MTLQNIQCIQTVYPNVMGYSRLGDKETIPNMNFCVFGRFVCPSGESGELTLGGEAMQKLVVEFIFRSCLIISRFFSTVLSAVHGHCPTYKHSSSIKKTVFFSIFLVVGIFPSTEFSDTLEQNTKWKQYFGNSVMSLKTFSVLFCSNQNLF